MTFGLLKIGEVFKFHPRSTVTYKKVSDKHERIKDAGLAEYGNQPNPNGPFFVLNDEEVILTLVSPHLK